jgi:hypothetical protein
MENINVNPQDIINILASKLAKSEADCAFKEAVNIALTKRVTDMEGALNAATAIPQEPTK